MSSIIQHAWNLQGTVTVEGLFHQCYVFKFENAADMKVLKDNSPMAVKNKLLVLDSWTPNMDYEHYTVESFPIWVQIWGLPLEYLSEDTAMILGTFIGPVHAIDFQDQGIRKLRYLHVRVQVSSSQPLMMGFYLNLDNGTSIWIQFRYERIFRICRRCGCIGHIQRDCLKEKEVIQAAINLHKEEIMRRHKCPELVNSSFPLFVQEAAAFCNNSLFFQPFFN